MWLPIKRDRLALPKFKLDRKMWAEELSAVSLGSLLSAQGWEERNVPITPLWWTKQWALLGKDGLYTPTVHSYTSLVARRYFNTVYSHVDQTSDVYQPARNRVRDPKFHVGCVMLFWCRFCFGYCILSRHSITYLYLLQTKRSIYHHQPPSKTIKD
jgi:hypothetical protein